MTGKVIGQIIWILSVYKAHNAGASWATKWPMPSTKIPYHDPKQIQILHTWIKNDPLYNCYNSTTTGFKPRWELTSNWSNTKINIFNSLERRKDPASYWEGHGSAVKAWRKRPVRRSTKKSSISLEIKWQINSQKKEGKRSNPHHICPTEKSKFLSIIKRKSSSTAKLEDRTHSISCHNTNRPSSFASEQATADWIGISKGLA